MNNEVYSVFMWHYDNSIINCFFVLSPFGGGNFNVFLLKNGLYSFLSISLRCKGKNYVRKLYDTFYGWCYLNYG